MSFSLQECSICWENSNIQLSFNSAKVYSSDIGGLANIETDPNEVVKLFSERDNDFAKHM